MTSVEHTRTTPADRPRARSEGRFDGQQPSAVNSALTILEAVAASQPGISAREIHEQVGIPRATVYRILSHLVAEEYLVRSPDLRGFALGQRMREFSRDASRHLDD